MNPPVIEDIDERILRLLGLEEPEFEDVDYESYKGYLIELLQEVDRGRKVPSDEVEMVRNEWKRIRRKKGRFKIKRKKINVDNITNIGRITKNSRILSGKIGRVNKNLLLPSRGTEKEDQDKKQPKVRTKSLNEILNSIQKSVDSILDLVRQQNALERELLKDSKKESENRRRKRKESDLEKREKKGAIGIIKSVLSSIPLLDKIFNFIKVTLLGRALFLIMEWFGNPENKQKVETIIRFLKDFWPALLGGYILFGTKLGKFIRVISRIVISGIAKLSKFAIPKLLRFIGTNPVASALIGGGIAAGTGAFMASQQNEKNRNELKEKDSTIVTPQETAETGKTPGPRQLQQEQILQRGLGFSGGGWNKGLKQFSGQVKGKKGVDKIPAMLSDGEFVVSAGAVKKYGVETFEAMNAAGGGTNVPQIVDGVTYASVGGYIGNIIPRSLRKNDDNKVLPFARDPIGAIKRFIKFKFGADLTRKDTWGQGYAGRAMGQVPRIASNLIGKASRLMPSISRASRIPGEASKLISPVLSRASRIPGEASKLISPALRKAKEVAGEAQQKIGSAIDNIKNYDFSGLKTLGSNIHGASTEALPALIASTFGISRTDKSISQDMQRAILEAQKNAAKRGQKDVDYGDYAGGGLSAAGLTMGKIGNDEFKRDERGRIIGIRQIYDTNRSARDAMRQAGESWEAFKKSGFKDMSSLGRVAYKPFEAWLAKVQHRGMTMHDVDFDEKVLGFKPGKEVLNDRQKKMIAEQKNREALQNKRPWWDKMGLFGGATAEMQRQQKNKPVYGPGGDPSGSGRGQARQRPQAQITKPKPTPKTVKPLPPKKPTVKPTYVGKGNRRKQRSGYSASQAPHFKPTAGRRENAANVGVRV